VTSIPPGMFTNTSIGAMFMKAAFGTLLVIVLGIWAIWNFGIAGYDPDADGQKHKAALERGMTWQQVIEAGKAPRKYQSIIETTGPQGETEIKVMGENRFRRELFEEKAKSNDYGAGFVFLYRYTEKTAFGVNFDGEGKVESVNDLMTLSDLLQY